ncbi:hypothetical protein [Marmoricola sp. RAF53]|uniref:hypothetical protein n=1 Tax=Marmoricola sp. RAF53 TaxID=3233059 RepID=UPI003F9B80A4
MPSSADHSDLLAVADELYGEPAGAFTASRDAAAKATADKALAARIKTLRKPSVAAWAVNLLVRREADQIDQVLAVAEGLRAAAASLDGEELRALTRQRRQLTAALTSSARSLAREHDVRLTSAVADQVEGVLTAAMLDPVAADVVRSGLLVTAFTATGLSAVDVAAVCAVPEALGHRAAAVAPPEHRPPVLTVVSDEAVRRDEARDRVHQATVARAAAEEAVEHLNAVLERLQARRLQLGGEIDELRRRLAGLEDEVDRVDEEVEEAEESHQEATGAVAEAVRELDDAEAALAQFE